MLTAYTMAGSPIFMASTHQQLGDKVALWLSEGRKPELGYTYDEGAAFPYTTWVRNPPWQTCGTSHKNYDEVATWWRNQNTTK